MILGKTPSNQEEVTDDHETELLKYQDLATNSEDVKQPAEVVTTPTENENEITSLSNELPKHSENSIFVPPQF